MENSEIFKFTGPKDGFDPEKTGAKKALASLHLEGLEKIEGELEKTELQLKAIDTVNQIIPLIFRFFGIKKDGDIDPDQVHFLPREEFSKGRDPDDAGSFQATTGSIAINADKIGNDNGHLIATILHESLHAISEQTFFTETNEDGSINLSESRVGFRIRSSWKEDFSRFRGLNEFIVCTLVYYSMERLAGVLEKRFGITLDDIQNKPIHGSGSRHSEFFDKIINTINNDESVNSRDFIINMVKSHFSGSLNVLKQIDLVFGPGSMRVLSYLDAFTDKDTGEQANALVEEYFSKADINRKKDIIEKLKNIGKEI